MRASAVAIDEGRDDEIARRNAPHLATDLFHQADALGDEDGLPIGVRVPGGSRAGREVHAARAQPRAMRWRRNCVDVDNAGEPLGRAGGGLDAALCDVHVVLLSNPAFEPSAGLGFETAVL